MPTDERDLIRAALTARTRAYAPYSHFRVGAAVQTEDGRIFSGCNVENASFGLTICAERNALCSAVAAGAKAFVKIAVAADGEGLPYPCGACRQVMAELCSPEAAVLVVSAERPTVVERFTVKELLPHRFTL